jgi:hypothetical protein
MISTRYLPALIVLLAFACLPTVVHTYMGRVISDGRDVNEIPRRLLALDSQPGRHSAEWVREEYGTSDFIERQYGSALTLFVARSYDLKGLYHHPELGIAHGDAYGRAEVIRTRERPEVPIFRLQAADGKQSMYALLYGDAFLEKPLQFQLRNALEPLIRPRAPMTLFFVRQTSASPGRLAPEGLLLAAIDSFLAQPASSLP